MKFYSEKLDEFFDLEEDCIEAEAKYEKDKADRAERLKTLKEEREAREKELNEANREVNKAKNRYYELLRAFYNDYGVWNLFK